MNFPYIISNPYTRLYEEEIERQKKAKEREE